MLPPGATVFQKHMSSVLCHNFSLETWILNIFQTFTVIQGYVNDFEFPKPRSHYAP